MGKRIVIVLLLVSILCGGLALPVGAVDLQLSAPSAVLMDLATGTVLYETNSHAVSYTHLTLPTTPYV